MKRQLFLRASKLGLVVGASGRLYRASGAQTCSSPTGTTLLQFTQSYPVLVQGQPQDPISPNDPYLPIAFVVSLDPFGDVGSSTATLGAD
jgi:hypothetical protein